VQARSAFEGSADARADRFQYIQIHPEMAAGKANVYQSGVKIAHSGIAAGFSQESPNSS
jgi:hypothetical protein